VPDQRSDRALEDHELIAMTQQYSVDHDGAYVAHIGYAKINEQVAAGRPWAKCSDCGNPYPLDREGASGDFCSFTCHDSYIAYLNKEIGRS